MDRLETFEAPESLNIQEWREWLVELGRNSTEAYNYFEGSHEEWNRQWDQLLEDGKYEVTVADLLLPALRHSLSLDIRAR